MFCLGYSLRVLCRLPGVDGGTLTLADKECPRFQGAYVDGTADYAFVGGTLTLVYVAVAWLVHVSGLLGRDVLRGTHLQG